MKAKQFLYGANAIVAGILLITAFPVVRAQTPAKQPAKAEDKALADQIRQLREQLARLESTVKQGSPRSAAQAKAGGMSGMAQPGQAPAAAAPAMGMGMMNGMPMKDGDSMAGMPKTPPGAGMAGMEGMSGMDMMGKMAGASQMADQAALPGFPGISHLYHVGAAGFFLDHPEHITLTTDQQRQLGQIKETAMLDKASSQRKIDEAEQQLFSLTAADQPSLADIQAKVREIGELQGQQRVAYIQAVGKAAQVLTAEQRQKVVGQEPAAENTEHH